MSVRECMYESSPSVRVCSAKLMRTTLAPLTLLFIPRFNENLIELPMKIKRNNDDTVGAGRERRLEVRVRLICFAIPAVDFVGVKGEYMR